MASPSTTSMPPLSILDPESESSDVSDDGHDGYHYRGQALLPSLLPPAIPRHALDSQDAIENRLRELNWIEDQNIQKSDALKAKRARKDDRIHRRREAQDLKIRAMMDARARRDDRIARRRKAEDDNFARVDEELEEEENNLRRRIKRLKRGLPVDDIVNHDTGVPSHSMSPPGPSYAGVPPPAKRHQSGPPGQANSPITSYPRPPSQSSASLPPPVTSNVPQYSFLPANHGTSTTSYTGSPTYANSTTGDPAGKYLPPHSAPPRPSQSPADTPMYGVNGLPASPHTARPNINPPPISTPTPAAPPPLRHSTSTYDTRPPPPASGFATINQPPPSGFAAINPRQTATPPGQPPPPVRDPLRAAEYDRIHGLSKTSTESTPPHTNVGTPQAVGKRTPSTTHPYQMSEAFANRHHHCERTDSLNRGIWTSYGPGGTLENPTAKPQEMYLRCNHNDCRRIDWKTVHGLQCHIVKNHEQPKGTIGSLDKALDRYGVPVSEVEAFERDHGEGSGGTVADPKNMKLRAKFRDSSEKADRRWTENGTQSQQPPPTYQANVARSMRDATFSTSSPGSNFNVVPYGPVHEPSKESPKTQHQPASGFAAVNGARLGNGGPAPQDPTHPDRREAARTPANATSAYGAPPANSSWQMRPPEALESKSTPATPMPIRDASLVASSSHEPSSTPRWASTAPAQAHVTSSTAAAKLQHIPDGDRAETAAMNKVAPNPDPKMKIEEDSGERSARSAKLAGSSGDTVTVQTSHPPSARVEPPVVTQATAEPEAKAESSKVGAAPQDKDRSDGRKSSVTSPETPNRRYSLAGTRRGSSRRSSLAVGRAAEREREDEKARERESQTIGGAVVATGTDAVEDHADGAQQANQSTKNEKTSMEWTPSSTTPLPTSTPTPSQAQSQAALPHATDVHTTGATTTTTRTRTTTPPAVTSSTNSAHIDTEDEQGDSITVQTSPSTGPSTRDRERKDRDKDKEKEKSEDGVGGGRTSRRLTNGRFIGKKR